VGEGYEEKVWMSTTLLGAAASGTYTRSRAVTPPLWTWVSLLLESGLTR